MTSWSMRLLGPSRDGRTNRWQVTPGCEPCVICGSPHATRGEMKLPDGQWVCSRPCELAAEAVRKAKDATEFRALAQKE